MQEPEQSLPNEAEHSVENSQPQELTLTGTTNESVTLQISDLLYIEAVGNYVRVSHLRNNQVHTDMLRATMKLMEETLESYPMIVRYGQLRSGRADYLTFWHYSATHQALSRITPRFAQQYGTS